jgi:hypothetical protein
MSNFRLAEISLIRNQSHGPDLERALRRLHINTSQNVIAGRNMTAGYARAWGLQSDDGIAHAIEQDPVYRESRELARGWTVVAEHKLMNLFLIMKYGFAGIDGDIVEFGSYKGGSAIFMANIARRLGLNTRIYALDTFQGMPETDAARDLHIAGDFNDTSIDALREYAQKHQLDNLIPVQGLFEHTAPALLDKIAAIALVHIDCDIYSAVKYAIEVVRPKMHAAGGYLAFDDALQPTCLGAMEEMIQATGLRAEQAYPHLVYRFPSPQIHAADAFDEDTFNAATLKEIELAEARAHMGALESQLRDKEAQLHDKEAQLRAAGEQCHALGEQLRDKDAQLQMRDGKVEELRENLAALYASTSWRVTAPLRALKAALAGRP